MNYTSRFAATLIVVALVVVSGAAFLALNRPQRSGSEKPAVVAGSGLSWFSSYDELGYYVGASTMLSRGLGGLVEASWWGMRGPLVFTAEIESLPAEGPLAVAESPPSYSKTNVQVEGVDEADIVKTDGKYIYVASGTMLWVVEAYPPEKLGFAAAVDVGTRIVGLYVYSDRVVVLASSPTYIILPEIAVGVAGVRVSEAGMEAPTSQVLIYQFSGGALTLLHNTTVTGNYLTSRMIGNTVYVLTQQPAFSGGNATVPAINGEPLEPGRIGYFAESIGTTYITILGVNVEDGSYDATALLSSPASWVYVSHSNLYVVTAATVNMSLVIEKLDQLLGQLQEAENATSPLQVLGILSAIRQLYAELGAHRFEPTSAIYRFRLDNLSVVPEAVGKVPGMVLDQFSMDEYGGYFRIATTARPWDRSNSSNAVYVLDMDLNIVGSVEGIAVGERIYAARFMGDLCFLVTFRQIDPLFAIDLSNPEEPRVLGFLEMPGFSEYLHPYGDDLLIGVGVSENREVKVAVFNISDPGSPEKVDEMVLGHGYTPVFDDHKAFLANTEKGYIAIPVILVDTSDYTRGQKQGSAIIDIDPETGAMKLRGLIPNENPWRTLYIDDIVYSISRDGTIVAYDYNTMEPVDSLALYGFNFK